MKRYRKITDAGAVREVEVSCVWAEDAGRQRGKKVNKSSSAKQARNHRNSVRLLGQLINANFTKEDYFLTLTHHTDVTEEQAKKLLDKFIRDVQKILRLLGDPPLKYIAVTENKHKEKHRIHHHIVMSALPIEILAKLWRHGTSLSSRLYGQDYTGLARYIAKDPVEAHKKKWKQSRGNLIHPKPEYKPAKAEDSTEAPIRTPKGYRCVDRQVEYYEEVGVWKYAKFLKNGAIDLSTGSRENKKNKGSDGG